MRPTMTFFAFVAVAMLPGAIAQTGVNSLPEVEFSQLSQRDPNPLGERALSINPTQWKHGETEHYIYHFAHSYVATPISVEAEFHYRVVAKELERDQPLTDIKSNVYIFERPEDWQQFQGLGELEKWTGGIPKAACSFSAIQNKNFPVIYLDTRSSISFFIDFTPMGFPAG
jgi:hypothetical protein